MLEREHRDFGAALIWIRTLTDNYTAPPGACVAYKGLLDEPSKLEANLHQQIHKENNILFPRARRLEAALEAEGRRANSDYTPRC